MDCGEFLENYSDFLDRRLEERPLAEYREHLKDCRSCAHYDQVVQRGLRIVRQLPSPEPARDFAPRLQHRLFHIRDDLSDRARRPSRTTVVTAFLILGLVVGGSVSLVNRARGVPELPPVVVQAAEARSPETEQLPGIFSAPLRGPNLLLVPNIAGDPWRISTSAEFSLFRSPVATFEGRQPGPERTTDE